MNVCGELGIIENIVIVVAEAAREASPRSDVYRASRFHPLNRPNIDPGQFRERVLRHVLRLSNAADPKAEELSIKEDWSLRHGDPLVDGPRLARPRTRGHDDGPAINIEPALVGAVLPDNGPPDDVKAGYLALVGKQAK